MITITDIKFTTPFSVSYLRNNRSSGQKSLRCFPRCTEKGHIASGFCGDHLIATATIKKNQACDHDWLDRITVIGEIRPFSDQGISSGKKVSRKKLLNELRDIRGATKSGGELLLGEMKIIREDEHTAVVTIAFNAEKHSWDYSWKSNRWSGVNNSHVVDVVLVESLTYMRDDSTLENDDELDVYSSACGDTFLILSSHKSPHLKRKLSAAAASAAEDDAEMGIETESGMGTGSNLSATDTADAYPLKEGLLRTSDPMSALLLALDDGNSTLPHAKQVHLDKSSSTGDPCAPSMQENAAVLWEETALLPPKRKRIKSLKMKEYSESIYHENTESVNSDSREEISPKNRIKSEPQSVVDDSDCGTLSALGRCDALERVYSSVNGTGGRDFDNEHDHDHDHDDEEEYHYDRGGHGEDEILSSDGLGASSSSKYSVSTGKDDLESADSKIFDLRWNETFAELVTYCDSFGHGNVPKDYKSPGGRWLGKWLDFQRQMKKKNRLRADRMVRLDRLVTDGLLNMYDGPRRGHRLSGENVHQWEGWYSALLEYGETNGTYNVPRHYIIPPSADSAPPVQLFNTVGKKLGRWLQTQRLRGRSGDLRGDRLKRLQELADTGRLDWLGNSVNNEKEKYSDAVYENDDDDGENSPTSSVAMNPPKIFKVSGIQRSPPPNTRSRVTVKEILDPDSDRDQSLDQDLDQDQDQAVAEDDDLMQPLHGSSHCSSSSSSCRAVEGLESSHSGSESESQPRAGEAKGEVKLSRKSAVSLSPVAVPVAVAAAVTVASTLVPTGRVASPCVSRSTVGDSGGGAATATAAATGGAGAGVGVGGGGLDLDLAGRDELHPRSPLNLNGLEALLFAATSH